MSVDEQHPLSNVIPVDTGPFVSLKYETKVEEDLLIGSFIQVFFNKENHPRLAGIMTELLWLYHAELIILDEMTSKLLAIDLSDTYRKDEALPTSLVVEIDGHPPLWLRIRQPYEMRNRS